MSEEQPQPPQEDDMASQSGMQDPSLDDANPVDEAQSYEAMAKEQLSDPLSDSRTLVLSRPGLPAMYNETSGIADKSPHVVEVPKDLEANTFDSNNGIVAFVDPDGKFKVVPSSDSVSQALEARGYTRKGMGVPFSNGGEPTRDRRVAPEWLRVQYMQEAEKVGVEILPDGISPEGDWMQIPDHVPLQWGDGSTPQREDPNISHEAFLQRRGEVGHYETNNGLVAFTDGLGRHYEGPGSQANLNRLVNMGYESGSVSVSLSNTQFPEGTPERTQFDALMQQAREEAAQAQAQ